jgi:hypothetical protein
MKPPTSFPNAAGVADDELIDVALIRLVRSACSSAVVSEFRNADRLLADWAAHTLGDCRFEFEITFIDGFMFHGSYEFFRKGTCRPSLSRYVRRALDPASDSMRYLVDA